MKHIIRHIKRSVISELPYLGGQILYLQMQVARDYP